MIECEDYTVVRCLYKVYCDRCGKLIGETMEHDDGWIPEPDGMYKMDVEIRLYGKSFVANQEVIACEECAERIENEFFEKIKEIGFEEK